MSETIRGSRLRKGTIDGEEEEEEEEEDEAKDPILEDGGGMMTDCPILEGPIDPRGTRAMRDDGDGG
eukprot:8564983-Pyramimonas_sp.AAC.1